MRSASRLNVTHAPKAAAKAAPKKSALGSLPDWDLSDLYNGPDDIAIENDIADCSNDSLRMKAQCQGRLGEIAADGAKLAKAVKEYEAISDTMGKLASYAGLYYTQNQADPARAKFYGDISEQLTKLSTNLLFFELELNQVDDNLLASALTHKSLKRYKPWFDDLLKEKPHQLDEKLETLFTEKSQTGRGAWNRLFNETMSSLKFDVKGEKKETLASYGDSDFGRSLLFSIGGLSIISATLFCWLAPNVWQFQLRSDWRTSIAMAALLCICILRFDAESPFLYFQF